MRIVMQIGSTKFLLSTEQLETVTNALQGVECIDNRYVGACGNVPSHYVNTLKSVTLSDALTFTVCPEEEYNAMKFLTAASK